MHAPEPAIAAATNPRAVQRRLAVLLSDRNLIGLDGPTIEAIRVGATEPARVAAAAVIEGTSLQAHPIADVSESAFGAFLDGTQSSKVIRYDDGVPIVHGTVGAAIRVRHDRRLTTWARDVESSVYVPRARMSPVANAALERLAIRVVDTTAAHPVGNTPEHPFALLDAAIHAVQREREALEQRLAVRWSGEQSSPLFIDGGISGDPTLARAELAVGVIKSHQLLYAQGNDLRVVLGLGAGERSSVFRIESPHPRRTPVASWYLRLRSSAGNDPMWGLVRVEIAVPAVSDPLALSERANTVSRWILAEGAPLALPDSRWHTMAYGIRDCEQFLNAISS